jgi:pilus assembly protein Flp/PilA
MTNVKRFINDESGVSAIEYGLIAALVAVAMIAGLKELGTWLGDTFDTITNSL